MVEMNISVLKFGGSSLASATNISRVLDIVEGAAAKTPVVVVCSAISGCTDALLQIAGGDLSPLDTIRKRHHDIAARLFTGTEREQLDSRLDLLFNQMTAAPDSEKVCFGELLSTAIVEQKLRSEGWKISWVDSRELIIKGDKELTYNNIRKAIHGAHIYVAPGFICGTPDGGVSTLGRGGSDYSAALYAAALGAGSLQIWTDVPGIMTANPRQVEGARSIAAMSYSSALDMASHGAKVLYAPTVAPAMEAGIDIEILNSFNPSGKFTVISSADDVSPWVGLSSEGKCIRLTASSKADLDEGLERCVASLKEEGIAATGLSKDGGGITLEVKEAVLNQALKALHRSFFQEIPIRHIPLFIAGDGAVSKALREMIAATADTVKARTGKELVVSGLANSKSFGFSPEGSPVLDSEGDFVAAVVSRAPKGSVFVDCTDSENLYKRYQELLEAGIGIVSSNRRSFAVPYTEYAAMHAAARENGVPLRYETTVGASLPVLESIARGANSCNELLSLEAVVSCTLNRILGDYRPGQKSFAALVREAAAEGLAERDPRLDIGGRDALRKLLILSREAGIPLEEDQVDIVPVVPLTEGPLEDFYRSMESSEPIVAKQYADADAKGCRLRFVASLNKEADGSFKAGIRLSAVPPSHPAFHLRGTENAIIVRSAFHPYPLVIQGPGEGAKEAASSILNDILR